MMPRHISARGKKLWPEIAALLDMMGVLTVGDSLALEGLVETYAELIETRLALKKRGSHTYEVNGMVRSYPEVAQISDLDRRLKSWLASFGCTPSDRSRVSATVERDTNPFGDL